MECVVDEKLCTTTTIIIERQKIRGEITPIDLTNVQVAIGVDSAVASKVVHARNRDTELEGFVIEGGISSQSGVRGTAAGECTRIVGGRCGS